MIAACFAVLLALIWGASLIIFGWPVIRALFSKKVKENLDNSSSRGVTQEHERISE